MDIVVTTFPAHASQNVGDNLIANSTIELLRARFPGFRPQIVYRENSLDEFTRTTRHNVVAPGFSVMNGTYPKLFSLFTDLNRMENFFPLGCSFQSVNPARSAFFDTGYDAATLSFLQFVNKRFGAFPCRDELIVERLHHFGLNAFYSGDMALYDERKIGSAFHPPKRVETIAITLQHHIQYLEQSVDLIKRLRDTFPTARRFVALHSVPNPMYKTLETRAKQLGCEVLSMYGDVFNLKAYDPIDVHIGYRLHGHIYFLRERKPSILLVEDARSWGFANTPGTGVGCFDALDAATGEPDDSAPGRAVEFLVRQISDGFRDYLPVFCFIDETFRSIVSPMMDRVAEALRRGA